MTTIRDRVSAGDIQDLAVAVEQLTEETRTLRQSIDDLRDDVVWAARQCLAAGYEVMGKPPPAPVDPLAPDADLHQPQAPRPSRDETDSAEYCCDCPRLTWNGNPDAPGIACENCGYVVAEMGQVAIWRDEPGTPATDTPAAEPEQRQGKLFE